MLFEQTSIPEVVLITPNRMEDERGYFSETFRSDQFEANIGSFAFVQENLSYSRKAGTVRGLHYQLAPHAQGKLVSCPAGALWDVAVDLRHGSSTFGRFVAAELSDENGCQLWIPPGFAHGFCTLKPETTICYKVTAYYKQEVERGLFWNDPALGITWPTSIAEAVVSDKDKKQPRLNELYANFA
ncbi:dTDP-4-dehydrorhamnose 3,5-epimerase [Ensifer adhaerens]|uniref:dTDP-4-dehydrorhamnose 3,5-epimerase n=1 Tax=Ensifer adhaerens TaxID=106592 RepID=UPI00399A7C45